MSRPDAEGDSFELASTLLEDAGLGRVVEIWPLGTYSNAHFVVVAGSDDRYVLRRFREQPPPHTARVRLDRERWTCRQLQEAGVPVPAVLAWSSEPGAEATLCRLVEGAHLGTALPAMPEKETATAWSSCGRAFAAVHSIDAQRAAAAGCEQVGIRSPDRSRGPWHHEEALTYLGQLGEARPDLGPLDALIEAVREALPLYERAPLAICQCDAHLWQFLVARTEDGDWRCTAILDWEDADLDDPDWDLAQLDGFRWTGVGPVPDSFFAAYGRRPTSPLYPLYRLERAAWILSSHATGGHEWLDLSVPPAERFVRGLLAQARRGCSPPARRPSRPGRG